MDMLRHTILSAVVLVLILPLLASCRSAPTETPDPDLVAAALTEMVPTALPIAVAQETTDAMPTGATEPPQPAVAFNPAYTQDQPLTDPEQIFAILEDLGDMEFAGVTKPGWYLRYDCYIVSDEAALTDCYSHHLVHVVDEDGHCQEQLHYYMVDDQIVPHLYMDAEGRTGATNTDGTHWWVEAGDSSCDLTNVSSLGGGTDYYILSSLLEGYRREVQRREEIQGSGDDLLFEAWFTDDDRIGEAFVVQKVFTNMRDGVKEDPDTGQMVAIASNIKQDFYVLSSGRPVVSYEETTLVNGKVVESEVQYILEYYQELPPDMQAVFDEAVAWMSEPAQ